VECAEKPGTDFTNHPTRPRPVQRRPSPAASVGAKGRIAQQLLSAGGVPDGMRTWIATLIALVLAAGWTAVADAKPDCRREGQTVAANSTTRVLETRDAAGYLVLSACDLRSRRKRLLGRAFGIHSGASPVFLALNAHYVATSIQAYDSDQPSSVLEVTVHDAKTGKKRRSTDLVAAVASLMLSAKGTAVWTERINGSVRVHALDSTGAPVLDASPGIEFGSTALAGNRAYWMRAGAAVSALVNS
jgi:hypothetical protein